MRGMSWGLSAWLLLACGARSATDNPYAGGAAPGGGGGASGGPSGGAGAACSNDTPALPIGFAFESNANLWIRRTCGIEYSVDNICYPKREPIQMETFCRQECGAGNVRCDTCGACPESAVQLADTATEVAPWDGYTYTLGTSSFGCTCYHREPVRSGAYDITVLGYLSYEDALAKKNGFSFTTPFYYPPPDGKVHVRLDFNGL